MGRKISFELNPLLKEIFFYEARLQDKNFYLDRGNISTGQSQRIGIIRDIVDSINRVILIDEPTSALDYKTSTEFFNFIFTNLDKFCIKKLIFTSHSSFQDKRVHFFDIS
jgi:ABC-type bacteriocin/lantibiotic exporter with double-glycine peptidase domain